ncbi:MAG TPA: hypothetical protein VIG87_03250 [Candidatus Udaeobacter sp.]
MSDKSGKIIRQGEGRVLGALGEEVTTRNPAGPPDMARLFDA